MVTIEEVKEDAGDRNAGLALYLRNFDVRSSQENIRQQREAREADEAGREQIVAEQEEPRPGSVEEMREGLEDQRGPEDEENVSESGSQRQDLNIRIDENRIQNDLDMDEMDNVDDVIVEAGNDNNNNTRHMQNDEDLNDSDMILPVRVAPTVRQNVTDWEALGFSPDDVENKNDENQQVDPINNASPEPPKENRSERRASLKDERHNQSEIDPLNKLYNTRSPEVGEEWYFTNNRRDVLEILSHYQVKQTAKRQLVGTPEIVNAHSNMTKVLTNGRIPLIIYFNQTYRPKFARADGSFVASCSNRNPSEDEVGSCKGSIEVNPATGEIQLIRVCSHESRRDPIAIELIMRKVLVLYKNKTSKEDIYQRASEQADIYGVIEDIWSNVAISRKIMGKLRLTSTNQFPPAFNWTQVDNIRCIRDTTGTFETNNTVLVLWVVHGSEEHIANAKSVHIDGKFSKIPSGFKQLYCVSSKDQATSTQIPLFFALTNAKDQAMYEELFTACKTEGLNPDYVNTDFEKATINAVQNVWPVAEVLGCHRHFKVAIHKKLNKVVTAEVADTAEFLNLRKTLYGLCFAPFDKLDNWFNLLKVRTQNLHPKIDEYFEYLYNTYYGPNARFEKELWHCERRSFLQLDFTNNGSEEIFAKFQRLFNHSNYKVIRTAVERSRDWALTVYRDFGAQRNVLTPARTDRPPLYRNRDFHRVVDRTYHCFRDFNASIHPWMHDAKLFH